MSENEDASLRGATAQCVGSTDSTLYQREIWDGGLALPVLSEAHSPQANARPHHVLNPEFTLERNVINQVNHWPGPNSHGGGPEQQTLVTDGGQDSPGDGVSHVDDRVQSLIFLSAVGVTTLGFDDAVGIGIVSLPVVAIIASAIGLWAMALSERFQEMSRCADM